MSRTFTFTLLSLFYMSKFFSECALEGSQDSHNRWKQIVYTNMPDIESDVKKASMLFLFLLYVYIIYVVSMQAII